MTIERAEYLRDNLSKILVNPNHMSKQIRLLQDDISFLTSFDSHIKLTGQLGTYTEIEGNISNCINKWINQQNRDNKINQILE